MIRFHPPAGMRGAHVQSALAKMPLRWRGLGPLVSSFAAASVDEIVECGGGVRLLIHGTPPRDAAGRRLALLIHGWEGSAKSAYILSLAARLWQAGFRVVRMNLRDHGGSEALNVEMFHSCRLGEALDVVRWAQQRYRGESVSVVGFSLGGNFALRIAARAVEENLRIAKIVAICPVLDPAETMTALDSGWLYRNYFLRKWKASMQLKRAAFPDVYRFPDLRSFTTLEDMTDFFVRHFTEYPDLESYLRGYALTGDRLAGLSVPAAVLLADDDPVIPVGGLAGLVRTDALHVERSRFGGHCGFVAGPTRWNWLDDYVLKRLN